MLTWAAAHTADLGIDPDLLAVGGESAGAGLAAAVSLLARDRGGPALSFQLLGIPDLDDRLDTPSMRAFTDTPIWHRPNAELSWDYYLGKGVRGTDGVSPTQLRPAPKT
ncbi:alpha/beta hydrolase fold domain-containing protein [Actinomadura madurae]|uniref:alpha/beta hydrolase fold domain-containing protein n=1 Tax=Actinomadura madurae TaxID=1993 RepID=UPI0020D2352C|nr:alpha/beta hydrolase fold domain-containing protein [Actinomadura madurae]MCP9984454.1 alpha/beta hydrolase [Actinomadura madurae]MCQ0020650.1 alpha/beta hydrolase [Actinomadura madurae]